MWSYNAPERHRPEPNPDTDYKTSEGNPAMTFHQELAHAVMRDRYRSVTPRRRRPRTARALRRLADHFDTGL